MKGKFIFVVFIALGIGAIFGILLQKYYPVGNILASMGTNNRSISTLTPIPTLVSYVPSELQGKLSLFILAGQSNMSGRGDLPKSQTVNPRIFVFGNDYHWKFAVEPIDDATGQVDNISEDPGAGFSPSLSFATSLLDRKPDMAIGLIPCALGNSSMSEWQRNLSDSSLYGSCLKRARAASPMGEIVGILFFQGESDALDPKTEPQVVLYPDTWSDKFSALVTNWRNDLKSPELPVVFAQIGTNSAPELFTNWNIVKGQQHLVKLPFSAMITTDDLPLKDVVHFTTQSYQTIGKRFAQAFEDLTIGKR